MTDRSAKDIKKILVKLGPTWIVYPEDVTDVLRKKYVEGEGAAQFSLDVGGPNADHAIQLYKVDFVDMQQINEYSGKPRKIKFIKVGERVENEDKFKVMEGKLVTSEAKDQEEKKIRQEPPKKPDDAHLKELARLERLECEKHELEVNKRKEQDRKERERVESERLKRTRRPPKYKIIYNSQVRSDAIRLALLFGDIPFEEVFNQGKAYRGYNVNGVLVLHENGFVSRSGLASLRFIGAKLKFYPSMIDEMAQLDEALGDLQIFQQNYMQCRNQTETDKFIANSLRVWERLLLKSSGDWLFGERMTIVDLELAAVIEWLVTKRDNINREMFAEAFPRLMVLHSTVQSNKHVVAYIADRKAERKQQRALSMAGGSAIGSMTSTRTATTARTVRTKKSGDNW
eukprot:GEMP01038520.1.p1 GENE.GEMP01038520.1~~GEMP01038520.1.p1  ORF type:complete len:400 (+),score=65.93 GEMP01038520.1:125-1324(+)